MRLRLGMAESPKNERAIRNDSHRASCPGSDDHPAGGDPDRRAGHDAARFVPFGAVARPSEPALDSLLIRHAACVYGLAVDHDARHRHHTVIQDRAHIVDFLQTDGGATGLRDLPGQLQRGRAVAQPLPCTLISLVAFSVSGPA